MQERLQDLATQIKQSYDCLVGRLRKTVSDAKQIGDYLNEAQRICRESAEGWELWVENNCAFSLRTAQAYMQIADNWYFLEAQSVAPLGVKDALRLLANHNKPMPTTASNTGDQVGTGVKPADGKPTVVSRNGRSPSPPRDATATPTDPLVADEDDIDPDQSPQVDNLDAHPIVDTENRPSGGSSQITPNEFRAVTAFVKAVGGWTRAKWLLEEGEKKWRENQNG